MDIFKYPLDVQMERSIALGKRWPRPLCVQLQNGFPMLWVMLQAHDVPVQLVIRVLPTGAGLNPEDPNNYVGTWQDHGLVWHLFAEARAENRADRHP